MTATTDLVDLEEFFADPEFAVPTISPDGTRIAYLAPEHGRRNVWVRGIDQDHSEAVCVTHDTRRGITTYHWTDDPRFCSTCRTPTATRTGTSTASTSTTPTSPPSTSPRWTRARASSASSPTPRPQAPCSCG